jgi:hypothetical protein
MNRPIDSNINIICIESDAFYALIDEVVNRISEKHNISQDKWIDDIETMKLLNIKSKTTLQTYRDNGKIRFTQPSKKVILYDRESIMQFLENKAKDTF